MNDQQLIDRVVSALDELTSLDPQRPRVDERAADVSPIEVADAGRARRRSVDRRVLAGSVVGLVALVVAGVVVLSSRSSDGRTVSGPDTSVPVAPIATDSGDDAAARVELHPLPYRLDLPSVTEELGFDLADPPSGDMGVSLVSADGSFDRVITIVSRPGGSPQPAAEPTSDTVEVSEGSAWWAAAAAGAPRRLQWRVQEQTLTVWSTGVDDTELIDVVDAWRTGQLDDAGTGLVVDHFWSGDEVVRTATYGSIELDLTQGVPTDVANEQARRTTIDGLPAWRIDRLAGSDSGVVAWRLRSGQWMRLAAPTSDLDTAIAAIRSQDVSPPTMLGSLTIEAKTGTTMLPVIAGGPREVIRNDAVLLDGSTPFDQPGIDSTAVFLPPPPTGSRSVLEQVELGDRITWTNVDGQVIEYVVNSYGNGIGVGDGLTKRLGHLVIATVGDQLQVLLEVDATRITSLGDEDRLEVIDPSAEGPAVSIMRPGSVRSLRTRSGIVVQVERGLFNLPTKRPFDAVCALVLGSIGACRHEATSDVPLVLDRTVFDRLGTNAIWVNVPEGTDVVRVITDGHETWQVPIDGIAVWSTPAEGRWAVDAVDVGSGRTTRLDASTLQAIIDTERDEHPDWYDDPIDGPLGGELTDLGNQAVVEARACLTALGLQLDDVGTPPPAGVDVDAAWAACVPPALERYDVAAAAAVTASFDDSRAGTSTTAPPCAVTTLVSDGPLSGIISGSGSCADGIEATLTILNRTDTDCGSDIMATVQPGSHRMWFLSTSGAGGATGRWAPMSDDAIEGVGIMDYPIGSRTWPIVLPPLDPGTYTFGGLGISCAGTPQEFELRFEVFADEM